MATDFTLPELGENIAGGDVVRLLVSPGDTVKKDQPILELETDKVTQEVPAPAAGVLAEILLDTDAEAVPGALLGRIDAQGGEVQAIRIDVSNEREAPTEVMPAVTARDDAALESRLSPSVKRAVLQHGIDPARIGAFGGSAGAILVAEAGTAGTGPLDQGSRLKAVVELSGIMDFAPGGQTPDLTAADRRLGLA